MTGEILFLVSIFSIGCVVRASPVPGGSTYESMFDWIQRLEQKEKVSEKLIGATQKLLDATVKDVASLRTQVDKLVSNGYLKHNIQDVTWQSLHMAATAACRAITAAGGRGPHTNFVYPRGGGKSCSQICKESRFEVCDGSLSIMGFVGKSASTHQEVGEFYNYGCNAAVKDGWEPVARYDIVTYHYHLGYCCCRTTKL